VGGKLLVRGLWNAGETSSSKKLHLRADQWEHLWMDEGKSGSASVPNQKPFGWPFWLLLGGTIVIFGGLTFPWTIRATTRSHQTEAINNLRQLGLALYKFEEQFGTFSNDSTAALVTNRHPGHRHGLSGSSSNVLLR
jgi:hypothetical protein